MKIELERMKFAIMQEIPQTEAMSLSVTSHEHFDFITDRFIVQLRGFIWGQQLDVIRYPADWRQAFKERWFPKWALKRWPVKFTEINIKVKYPDYMFLPEKNYGKHIIFTTDSR